MRLRRSRQSNNGFLLLLLFWVFLRKPTGAICAGIYPHLTLFCKYVSLLLWKSSTFTLFKQNKKEQGVK